MRSAWVLSTIKALESPTFPIYNIFLALYAYLPSSKRINPMHAVDPQEKASRPSNNLSNFI